MYAIANRKLSDAKVDVMKPTEVLNWFESQKFSNSTQKVYLSAIKFEVKDKFAKGTAG